MSFPDFTPVDMARAADDYFRDQHQLSQLRRSAIHAMLILGAEDEEYMAMVRKMARFTQSSEVKQVFAGHKNTPPDILEDIFQKASVIKESGHLEDPFVLYAMIGNEAVSTDMLDRIAHAKTEFRAGHDYFSGSVLGGVVRHPATSLDTLTYIAKMCPKNRFNPCSFLHSESFPNPEDEKRPDLATHPNMTPEVLSELALMFAELDDYDGNRYMEGAFVQNKKMPVDTLVALSTHESRSIRQYLLGNPNLPDEIFDRILGDLVAQAEAGDKRLRSSMLSCIIKDIGRYTPVLDQLAEHEIGWVRRGVALNKYTPVSLLQKLADDERGAGGVAKNPNTPPEVIDRLAHSPGRVGYVIACDVTRNPSASTDTLVYLAEKDDSVIRRSVAANKNLPVGDIERLSKDRSSYECEAGARLYVYEGVLWNPSTPTEVLERMCDELDGPEVKVTDPFDARTVTMFRRDLLVNPRQLIAAHANASERVLRELALDEDDNVRISVCYNENVTKELLGLVAAGQEADSLPV
ncbi:MAG: hypothetical protein ABIE94_03970 [archaeon]